MLLLPCCSFSWSCQQTLNCAWEKGSPHVRGSCEVVVKSERILGEWAVAALSTHPNRNRPSSLFEISRDSRMVGGCPELGAAIARVPI